MTNAIMTSLAYQLKKLALPQSDRCLFSRHDVASLLFDPKDAATMDRSTFYALGCTGLEELLGIEPAFLEFQNTLFSQASLTLERSVQSKEVNEKLDTEISLFLTRLTPYFLLKPAQKCTEWLVHRFHIHLYNTDSLLACVLPYHDTNVFVRVVQLLKIQDPTSCWNWLHSLQKPGVPLSRGTLITHCYSDLSFLDFLCNMVTRSIQAYSGHSETYSQLRVVFSFYASTIVPALDAVGDVSDTIISKLLPYIQKGLKSSLSDYKAATYMIVCQLAVKVVMEGSLVDSLAVHISKSLIKEPVLPKEGLGCMIVLLQNQKEGTPGSRAFGRLTSMPTLVSTLQTMAMLHDVSPLLRHLLPYLIHSVFQEDSGEEKEKLIVLESILKSVPLTKELDRTVARLMLDEYLSQTDCSDEDMSALDRCLLSLVHLLESRYGSTLDDVLASHVNIINDVQRKCLFHRFLSLSVSSGKYQILGNSDTSLLLSLKHPQPSVRISALEHLMNIVISAEHNLDESFLKDAMTERLKDDVPEVVAAALKVLEVLLDILDHEHVVMCLLSLVHRADSLSERWLLVLKEAFRLLSDSRLRKGRQEQKTSWRLLPLLVVTSNRTDLARCVAQTPFIAQHPLTLNWAEELDKVILMSSKPDFVRLANEHFVSTVTKNLINMEHFCRRDALDQLTLLVEQQSGDGFRSQASFVLLSHVLLLGMSELNETLHLLTAQRIFTVLVRLLKELSKADQDQGDTWDAVGSVSISEVLTLYLRRCEQLGERSDREYLLVLTCLLRDFISSLKCYNASFKDEVWWNPESLDSNTCCYLGLICHLFSLLITTSADGKLAGSSRELLKLLIKVHLPEPVHLFRYLCLLWGYGDNQEDQLDVRVGFALQAQVLYVGQALLSIQSDAMLDKLASAEMPVVPSLLCCLTSSVREVRRAGLGALKRLTVASSSSFQPITERLLKTSEEIEADPSYLTIALGLLHEECATGKKKKLQVAMDQLLRCIQASCCPSYSAVTLLTALNRVNGPSVLVTMLPILDRLLEQSSPDTPAPLRDEVKLMHLVLEKFNEQSATLLVEDQKCLGVFVRAVKTSTQHHLNGRSCQVVALEQVTKPFFSALPDRNVQQKLLSVMFDLLVESRCTLVASTISSVFKRISVDGQLVANELAPPEKPIVTATVQQTRRSKMSQRKPQGSNSLGPSSVVSWQRVTVILELLQFKKKLKRAQTLVPVLFSLLARSQEPCLEEQVNTEYTKQLLLSCLLNICQRLTTEGRAKASVPPTEILEEEHFSVELVVQCVRASNVPQTHHHALLLLGAIAAIFPEKVLHNIMPIFTFMGANVLRLDDGYSFRVIENTLHTVIPALIQTHRCPDGSSSTHLVAVVTRILHVFVDALPHMPAHRRQPVLSQLVSTLGPSHFLWVLMLLLFKQHAAQCTGSASNSDKDAARQTDVEFWISLCVHFSVGDQLTSFIHLMSFMLQLPDDKDNAPEKRSVGQRATKKKSREQEDEVVTVEELIFSVETHSSKELRHFKFLCISFMAELFASSSFIAKLTDSGEDDDTSLEPLQQKLLEEVLKYIQSVARCVEMNANKPTAKFWRIILNKCYDVLDKVNALLPADSFLIVMRGLMCNELPSVRRKALELLNNKMQQRTMWEEAQVTVLLQLTDDLLSIVGKSHTVSGEEAEQAINRQTALYSLKLLCRSFGTDHKEVFVPVLQCCVEVVMAREEEKNVTGSALLCIAEVVSTLKTLAIPQLPRLMPVVLHSLRERRELLASEIYLLSAVTALQRVAESLPHFISPYLQDTTTQVCRLTRLLETSSSSSTSSSQLSLRLASLRSTLATKLPPRVLLPTVSRCYSSMVLDKKGQLGALMSILKEHISHMEKEQLSFHQSELTDLFLTALDFRGHHCQGDLEKTSEVEGNVINCFVTMVMKLSEVKFRPLFFKLCDWSKSSSNDRLLTFFRLCDRVTERLKGLFLLFAGNLIKPFSDLLRRAHTEDCLFMSDCGEQKTCLLLRYILDCLHKLFLYDTQHFLSAERGHALLEPLVQQLENMVGGEQEYQQRVTHHLLPCVGQFSVALADNSQWKTLNYQILLRTRHPDSKVRFSSLLMLMEVASKLKENYIVLLPETIPFLAELMEDECEEVEQQVQKVVQEMENILGEPLQSYF